ncbi:MAG: type III-B CRISPR module RAMP protein Cmr6 [Desulfobulbaceae bacterium]|jgi:CRISPR-associated protein Cmr6|nr:type III-B CRISPR module RAMP protein Cmr6 [Desulfobulbaceae bacterium]
MTINCHYLFNVEYFRYLATGADADKHCQDCNDQLIDLKPSLPKAEDWLFGDEQIFHMKTTYPGLLAGLGYAHESFQKVDRQIKLGFSLDFVTGLPIIPGSSVKGGLRSLFRHEDAKTILPKLLQHWPKIATADGEKKVVAVDELAEKIFGEAEQEGQVVFFDAVPVRPGKNGKIFGLDTITPHLPGSQDGQDFKYRGLTNPVPLKMLKVIANVTFFFRFRIGQEIRLADGQAVAAKDILALFKELLEITGLGAKTNTGFGALKADEEADEEWQWERELRAKGMSEVEIAARKWVKKLKDDQQFAEAFGKNLNTNRKKYPCSDEILRQIGLELRGETIKGWKNADKKSNQRKAYKFFFPSQNGDDKP